MYTILGITGNTGGAAASALLASGRKVRGVVRNKAKATTWQARGVELIEAELADTEQMKRAFEGSEGVYVMLPTYFEAADMFAENTRDLMSLKGAVQAARVQKVVFLSSIGAERDSGTGAILKLHEMETVLSSLPISTASIRAGWFMENFDGLIATVQETGVLWSFLDPLELRVPMIATADIGALAAALLQESWTGRRVIELAAEPAFSMGDVAKLFSKVFEREINAAIVPRDRWIATYQSWGLTPRSAEAMAEMIEGFNSHRIGFGNESVEHVEAKTTLEQVLRERLGSTQA